MNAQVWMGILLPFLGTSLGAAMVFVLKDRISDGVQRMLTGFAAGVMVAASFWSLLQPALDGAEDMGRLSFIPAAGDIGDGSAVSVPVVLSSDAR